MARPVHTGALQIDQDLQFQQREWRAQRVGWVVMIALLIAAVAGLLGPGPASSQVAGDAGGAMRVEYNRFAHATALESLRIHLAPGTTPGDVARVRLGSAFIGRVQIRRLYPEPRAARMGRDGITYEFGTSGGTEPVTVRVLFEYERFGKVPVEIELESGPAVTFTQWVYP